VGRLVVGTLIGVFAALLAGGAMGAQVDVAPSMADETLFRRLEPHMTLAGLRLEEATLESAMRRLGTVDRKDWLKGTKAPFICYVGPDGTRLGLGFGASEGLPILGRFELAAATAELEFRPNSVVPKADRPTCLPVKKLFAQTGGGLRLGMTKVEVTSLLGKENGGSGEHSWAYSGSVRLELTPAQREILVEAGVIPADFLVERELRLEFKNDRLVAIRARQLTHD